MSSYNLQSRQNITEQTSNSSSDEKDISNNEENMQNHQIIQDAVQQLQEDLRNLTTRQTISHLPPPLQFSAKPGEDPVHFINDCLAWCEMNGQQNENNLANLFQLILKGPAYSWFNTLTGEIKQDRKQLEDAFKDRFVDNTTHIRWMQEQ